MLKIKTLIKKFVKTDFDFYEVQDQLKNTKNAFILIGSGNIIGIFFFLKKFFKILKVFVET